MVKVLYAEPDHVDSVISGIIDVTGRDVIFVIANEVKDVSTNSNQDPFANPYPSETLYSGITMRAMVRWKEANIKLYTDAGQYLEGDCLLTIHSPSEDLEYTLQRVKSVVVDNKNCTISSYNFAGSPPHVCYISVKEDDTILGYRV